MSKKQILEKSKKKVEAFTFILRHPLVGLYYLEKLD